MIIITRYILLLDDDLIELNNTKSLIENDIPSIAVITTNSYEESIHYIDTYNQNIEAYILDIELSDSKFSGIDVAKFIRNDPKKALVPIIFTTSYSHYGSGFLQEVHYYDFFVKPYDKKQLLKSIKGSLSLISKNSCNAVNKLSIPLLYGSSLLLNFNDVTCIEINGKELSITNSLGKVEKYYVKYKTFSNIINYIAAHEELKNFIQIHRCIIINAERIKKIQKGKNIADIWLFNLNNSKPVGKTFLHQISIFNKKTE